MDPTVRRLLGLDVNFAPLSSGERESLLVSYQRRRAYDNITTDTLPQKPKAEQKKGIVAELLRKDVLDSRLLKELPTVYVGSGIDVEYVLSMGAREILLVDTIFSDRRALQDVHKRLERLTGEVAADEAVDFDLKFDFGEGLERVHVQIDARPFVSEGEDVGQGREAFELPSKVGTIVMYAPQGPSGVIRLSDRDKNHVVNGGVIVNGYKVERRNAKTGEWSRVDLESREGR